MSDRYLVRGGSRHSAHGSWRAGFHWDTNGDKEVVLSREQVAELKGDKHIHFIVVGRTAQPLTRPDNWVNALREVAAPDVTDLSFLDGIGYAPGEGPAPSNAPAPGVASAAKEDDAKAKAK